MNAVGPCEAKSQEAGEIRDKEYIIFYSGTERGGCNVIGVVIGKRLKERL